MGLVFKDTPKGPSALISRQTQSAVLLSLVHQGSLHYTPEQCITWFPFILVGKAIFQMGKMYLFRLHGSNLGSARLAATQCGTQDLAVLRPR